METIEAGILKSLMNTAKGLAKGLDKLLQTGMKLGEVTKGNDDVYTLPGKLPDGTNIKIMFKPIKNKAGFCKLRIVDEHGIKDEDPLVKDEDYNKRVAEMIKDTWGQDISPKKGTSEENTTTDSTDDAESAATETMDQADTSGVEAEQDSGEIQSCAKMKIALRRVVGSSEDTLELMKISGEFSIPCAPAMLDTISQCEELMDSLPDNEMRCFSVADEGDVLDVNPCEDFEVDKKQSICDSIRCITSYISTVMQIGYNCKLPDQQNVVQLCKQAEPLLLDLRDALCVHCIECFGDLPNVFSVPSLGVEARSITTYTQVASLLQNAMAAMLTMCSNFEQDLMLDVTQIIGDIVDLVATQI